MDYPVSSFQSSKNCIWVALSKTVNANGRQFKSAQKLNAAIIQACDNIDATVRQGLVNILPHCIFQIIYRYGGYIDC